MLRVLIDLIHKLSSFLTYISCPVQFDDKEMIGVLIIMKPCGIIHVFTWYVAMSLL